MSKKITKTEFVGLPISKPNETAILAIVAQRQQVEQQLALFEDAINEIGVRLAKEAGWDVPAAELRIERGPDGGLALVRQEAKSPAEKPPTP